MLRIQAINDEEVEAIHQSTLRILSEVGIFLTHPEARRMLAEANCTMQDSRVRIPADLVEWAAAQCPPQVTVHSRTGEPLSLGDGNLHWHNLGGARDFYDPVSEKIRPAYVKDVQDSTRLLDALKNVNSITPFFTPQDVPGELMSLAMYRHTLPFTTKPVQGPGVGNAAEVRYAVAMAAVIGPPKEVLTLGISPVSPLFFPDNMVSAVLETAKAGVPLTPLPCPTSGTTAPMSIAGAVTQQNAEVLATIVLAQLVNPGLPIVYCGRLAMMEPRTGASIWGGVELGLASAATVQIGHRYNLPVNVYGLSTNAHVPDLQNGYERALNAIVPALAGADELSGIGEMQAGISSSFAQMVLDDEIAASVKRLRRGFEVNADSLAVEVIADAMAGPRNFLSQPHTVRYLRGGEIFITKLAQRGSWEEWQRSGKPGMETQAQSQAEHLLAEHEVPPLEEAQENELNVIMRAAGQELAGT